MGRNTDQAEDRAQWARNARELVGKVIGGKYLIEKIIGRGGMGTIYVAEQQPLGRRVAIKVLHPSLGDENAEPEFQKRFLLEAATLSQLAHPNIVVVHDYGSLELDGHAACFMAMEFLEGRTINDVLNECRNFDPLRALRITRDIARALRAAHHIGVIHRDLKPANVMLSTSPEGESVKVLDFGLVKVLRDDSEELTAEGRFLGSPRYMSPEQIQRLPMDGRSDLYSLGVILFRMLTGEVPFAGDHAVQTLMAHLSEPVPWMEKYGLRIPREIEEITRRLLEKSPDDRYPSADAVIRAIDGAWPQLTDEPLVVSGEHARVSELALGPLPKIIGEPTGPTPKVPDLAAKTAPEAPAPTPSSRRMWILVTVAIVGLAGGIGGAAVAAKLLAPPPRPRVHTVVVDDRRPPRPPTPPPPVGTARTFTLTVHSVPEGAELLRDDVVLGRTPLSIPLDATELSARPASFVLRMRGRETVRFTQGPADGDRTIERRLTRVRRSGGRGHQAPSGGRDLSIKTRR